MALTKVSGHVIDQPFDVGIITATNFRSGVATVGTMHVTGNLQVDGTTTTLDTIVTEVDRLEVGANNSTVGLAVTQSGSGRGLSVDGDAVISNTGANPLDLYKYGTNSPSILMYGANGTAASPTQTQTGDAIGGWNAFGYGSSGWAGGPSVRITAIATENNGTTSNRGADIKFETVATGGTSLQEKLRITSDGSVGIGLTNPEWNIDIKDTSANAVIRLKSSGSTNGGQLQVNSDDLILRNRDAGELQLWTNDANKLTITSDGKVRVPDNGKFTAGAGDDLEIYHDGTINYIDSKGSQLRIETDALRLRSDGGETYIEADVNGAVQVYYNNLKKFETTSYGAKFSDNVLFNNPDTAGRNITWEADNDSLHWEDNTKATFGGGNDLQIYHTGSNSYIDDVGTGNLNIRSNGSFITLSTTSGETMISAKTNGAIELNHDNSKKFETTATGAKVTGALEVTQEYPSIRPTLDLNFAATKTLDRRITFTRDSIGTFTDDMGIVRYASNNVPRFDHDPTTGESLGLLIEESRTNLITYSEDYSGGSWVKTGGVTVTANDATAPDGTTTADRVDYDGSASSGSYRIYTTPGTTVNGTKYITSVWMKSDTPVTVRLSGNGTASGGATIICNVTTEWQRFSTNGGTGNGTTAIQHLIYSDTSSNASFSIYVWGSQIEIGTFTTSYIPTSGSTVTRAQDTAKITGTNFTDFYNQEEGTLVAHYHSTVDDNYVATFENTATPGDDRIGLVNYAGYQGFVETGNSGQASLDNGTPTVDGVNKVAFAFKTNDFAVSLNSATPVTDTIGTMPTVGRMMIGSRQGGAYDLLKSTIRHLSYYPKRLSNAQLQGLTQQ